MFAFLSQGPLGELLAPVKTPPQQLHQAIEDHLNDKAHHLIQEGVYYNAPDPARGDALPIHTACQAGNQGMLDALIELGADINAKDRYGNLPLHSAAKAGKMEMVKLLIGRGADVSKRNNYRQTAYDVAESHIVRQYLLPLQLRAEPEPAPGTLASVHNPDVVRDYSNLAPPPTMSAYSAPQHQHHQQQHHQQQHQQLPQIPQYNPAGLGAPMPPPSNKTPMMSMMNKTAVDPSVHRPIAADGFHCSVGNPELAAKYGHTKAEIHVAPPPGGGATGSGAGAGGEGGPRPQANPTQYSAFAAYGGRPPPRYVTYNATNNTSAPFIPPNAGMGGGGQYGMAPPVGGGQGSNNASPVPVPVPSSTYHQQQSNYAASPPLPGPPAHAPHYQQTHTQHPQPSGLGSGASSATASPVPVPPGYRGSPLPPPPPLPQGMVAAPAASPQPPQYQQHAYAHTQQRPTSAGIPTLPAPNAVSVFQPLADNGDDAIPLDGSVSKVA